MDRARRWLAVLVLVAVAGCLPARWVPPGGDAEVTAGDQRTADGMGEIGGNPLDGKGEVPSPVDVVDLSGDGPISMDAHDVVEVALPDSADAVNVPDAPDTKDLPGPDGEVSADVGVDAEVGDEVVIFCVPNCEGKECGTDGCGGICGECGSLEECAVTNTGMACASLPVEVPAGTFWMGCNNCVGTIPEAKDKDCDADEHPYHEVYVSAFEIDATEVTAAQYGACVSTGECTPAGTKFASCTAEEDGLAGHPVNCVTWEQADEYCSWVGKRLCTEAEWEKGARGGCEKNGGPLKCKSENRKYPWGNDALSCALAVKESCNGDTQPVCSRSPEGDSPYGLCDMVGNVWEWVADGYGSDYYCKGLVADTAAPWEYCGACGPWPGSPAAWTDPVGPMGPVYSRLLRGGGFWGYDDHLRVSKRFAVSPSDEGLDYYGIRCCKSVTE